MRSTALVTGGNCILWHRAHALLHKQTCWQDYPLAVQNLCPPFVHSSAKLNKAKLEWKKSTYSWKKKKKMGHVRNACMNQPRKSLSRSDWQQTLVAQKFDAANTKSLWATQDHAKLDCLMSEPGFRAANIISTGFMPACTYATPHTSSTKTAMVTWEFSTFGQVIQVRNWHMKVSILVIFPPWGI